MPKRTLKTQTEEQEIAVTEAVVEVRDKLYGGFINVSVVSSRILQAMNSHTLDGKLKQMQFDDQCMISEGLRMICNKLGRIASGDPSYEDSWRDIAGYATLVANHLQGEDVEN